MSIKKASIYASEQRFRAILMTAISTLVGFMPLLIASGAGSVSRWSLGTGVFGGMLVATVLSLIFVPILYIIIKEFKQSYLKGGKKDGRTGRRGALKDTASHNGRTREQEDGEQQLDSNNHNGRSDRIEDLEQQESKTNKALHNK